jgi:hypothetical protein
MNQGINFQGKFHVVCRDKSGKFKWEVESRNLVTLEGRNHALSVLFNQGTQIATWYLCPFESDTTILSTHTYAVPGYTECTAYDEATRVAFVEAAPAAGSLTNSANRAVFTFNATKTIYGMALVSVNTKGDTGSGVLWCASQFTNSKNVDSGDTIEVTYTLTAADDGV